MLCRRRLRRECRDWAAALFHNKLVHDFGTVAAGAVAEHRFVVENIYLEDVEIGSVTTSCGCTKLSVPKKLLKTYETAEIIAELDTRNFGDKKEATIHASLSFRRREPNRSLVQREVQLKLKAFIRKDLVFQPGLVQFDSLQPGQTAEKHVTLSYAGRADWQILEAPSPVPYLAVKFTQTGRNYDPILKATQVTYDLLVKLKETPPTGYFQDQITLKTNDQTPPRNAGVPLVVQGYIVPTLSVSPTPLMLGEHKPGETAASNLVVKGVKGKPFRILGVSWPDDQFRFTWAPGASDFQKIGVRFTAGNKPGRITGKIRITTDLDSATVDVDVDGKIVPGDSPAPGAGPAKPEGAKTDLARPGASGFDAAKPAGNVLRRSKLKAVEPDGRSSEK